MSKVIVLLLILAVVGGLVWLLAGGSRNISKPSRRGSTRPVPGTLTTTHLSAGASQLAKMRESHLFWGVTLQNPGCDAAMDLVEKEIPLAEAPNLPLRDCNAIQCSCSWKGLKEQRHRVRRTQQDRRDGVRFDEKESTDRRAHKDRRKTDSTWERRNF